MRVGAAARLAKACGPPEPARARESARAIGQAVGRRAGPPAG